jgi:non-ribosomal peptide synthetase component F
VAPAAGRLVRVDVRELVLRWRLHEQADHGIAVVADATSATGMAFALSPVEENDDSIELSARGAPVFGGAHEPSRDSERTREVSGPRLELYVK